MAAKQEIARLRDELNRHNRLYYEEAAPEISDREYDRLMDRLMELEAAHPELVTPDSPSRRVGGAPLAEFATVAHSVPMLSIDNTYNYDEVREWDARVRRGLNKGEAVKLRRRAQGRRRGRLAAVRGGRVRPGSDPRRRRAGRRHHGQPADRPRDPAEAARPPPCPARGPGRGLHDQLRARPAQRAPQGGGGAAVREPEELHRRLAQAARSEDLRPAAAPVHRSRAGEPPRASTRARTTRSPGSSRTGASRSARTRSATTRSTR